MHFHCDGCGSAMWIFPFAAEEGGWAQESRFSSPLLLQNRNNSTGMSEVLPAIALYHRDQSLPFFPHILSYTSMNMQTAFLPSLFLLLIPTVEVLAWATINIPLSSNTNLASLLLFPHENPGTVCVFSVIKMYIYNPNPEASSQGCPFPLLPPVSGFGRRGRRRGWPTQMQMHGGGQAWLGPACLFVAAVFAGLAH